MRRKAEPDGLAYARALLSGPGDGRQVHWSVRANAAPKGKGIRECMGRLDPGIGLRCVCPVEPFWFAMEDVGTSPSLGRLFMDLVLERDYI